MKTVPVEQRAVLTQAVLERRGDDAGQVALARARVAEKPADADRQAVLGVQLLKAKQVEEGRGAVRKAVELGAGFGLVRPFTLMESDRWGIDGMGVYALMETYHARGILGELEKDLAPLLKRTNAHRAAYLQNLAGYLRQTDQLAEAIKVLERHAELDPYQAAQDRETMETLRQKLKP